MKNALYLALAILILGNLSHFGLPWWAIVPVAAVAAWIFPLPAGRAFAAAFLAGVALWCANAALLDSANAGLLSAKIGALFQGLKNWHLLAITGLLGGLLAGLGALTGLFARQAFVGERSKRR